MPNRCRDNAEKIRSSGNNFLQSYEFLWDSFRCQWRNSISSVKQNRNHAEFMTVSQWIQNTIYHLLWDQIISASKYSFTRERVQGDWQSWPCLLKKLAPFAIEWKCIFVWISSSYGAKHSSLSKNRKIAKMMPVRIFFRTFSIFSKP